MKQDLSAFKMPVWAVCWLIVVVSAVLLRPPLPVDETRYLAVAWEMWLRDDFLVPHLNGAPYHHKPPLLFWLMTAGWSVFGVNDWWPRLVAPLFALVALLWTGRLALRIWPDDGMAARLAPVILAGAAFWAVFQTLTMFDMMLAACTLAGIGGIVSAWRSGGLGGWLVTALAIGVGVLAKGPAILLHIAPVALLAPWWGRTLPGGPDRPLVSWRVWYFRFLFSVLIGAAIALAWAVPAGIRGGEEYRNMIFWGQSAGRIVESFDHARPFWWYAMLLAPLLLPWLIWPRLWRAARVEGAFSDGGLRLLMAWVAPAFITFSLISGKQLHYLLPEFPAFALLFARLLARPQVSAGCRLDGIMTALFFIVLGLAAMLLPDDPTFFEAPEWFHKLDNHWGVLIVISGLLCWHFAKAGVFRGVCALALSMTVLVFVVHLTARDALDFAYDLRPIARDLKSYEDKGLEIGNFSTYHGQYQFLGRLNKPVWEIGLVTGDTETFAATHPDGVIVAYYYVDEMPEFPVGVTPLATYRFRSYQVVLWRAGLLVQYPDLANRS
ncbi:glycosyltransferase family 39 protein [Thalassospiraceae bacterium LMO-JJ14]|nr:glycosyltransferase family 39 protein [Thalassospiraceae bacterium LMO-JJ14]